MVFLYKNTAWGRSLQSSRSREFLLLSNEIVFMQITSSVTAIMSGFIYLPQGCSKMFKLTDDILGGSSYSHWPLHFYWSKNPIWDVKWIFVSWFVHLLDNKVTEIQWQFKNRKMFMTFCTFTLITEKTTIIYANSVDFLSFPIAFYNCTEFLI